MNEYTEKRAVKRIGRSFVRRVLSVLLALMMVFELSVMQLQVSQAAAESINLENYLSDSTMQITVYIDGVKHTYTPAELVQKGLTVPKGAPVKVELYFNTISGVQKGQTLVYQLPENLMDYSGANEYGYVWQDIVWEENSAGAEVEAADWVIDDTGKLTVTVRDDFFESNKQGDTVDLFGFNIKFSGNFSSERGENSGNGDNEISFRGEAGGKVSFTIPFEYKNENANVEVAKTLVNFDTVTKTASYAIKVTAPDTNTYTSKNVVVTDELLCDQKYIKTTENKEKNLKWIYQNYVASTGADTFEKTTGIWTIGDMEPGQEETLTYDLIISDDAYEAYKSGKLDGIQNLATVTFNDDGVNQSYATLDLPNTTLTKTVDSDSNGVILTTVNGETYMSYTLTVTAYYGDESDIMVTDAFGDPSLIKRIEGTPSHGTVTFDNEKASFIWKIATLKKGETAVLNYHAYLEEDEWQIINEGTTASSVSLKVNNAASMYIGDDMTETPVISDADSASSTIEKTWVKKEGEQITDKTSAKYGLLKYTVAVNGDPVSDNVVTIYDTLTSGGTYEEGGSIELSRYTSSDKSTLVDTTTIPLADVVTADGSGYRWDINLVDRKLNGAYYYELVYYVKSSSVYVNNHAGIGFGEGLGYGADTKIQGGGGMTYGTDYSKSIGTDNWKEAYTSWTVTVQKTIPKGAVYVDWLSPEYVYKHEQFWFNDECLKDIVITFEGNTLTQGTDYTVQGVRYDNTNTASITDPDGKRYSKFEITFNDEYAASSSNKLIISYKVRNNIEPKDQGYRYSDGCTALSYNYCNWKLPEYGNLVSTANGANYQRGSYSWDTPLKKGNGTYNEADGTVTWYLTINTNTTIDGDATLVEYLPEGLSFVSAEVSARPFKVLTADTDLGEITQEEYVNSNGKTCVQVNIQIKNLHAYLVTSSRFPTGVGETTGRSRAGEITVKVVTKVDEEWRLNLSANTSLTNKAVLTDNDSLPANGVTATGTATIPSTQLIDKSLVAKENPAYIQYALNVNANGNNLIPGTGDMLEIVDIMGEGMSLSTAHTNSFKVYDVTDVSDLLDSDGNVIASKAQTGVDITDQCSLTNITGQYIDGMTQDEVGKPTYLISVPDGKHLAVVYWATFEGADGDSVTVSNKASFFYKNALQTGSGDSISNSVSAAEASSSLFVGPFFYIQKTDQWGNLVEGVKYTLYEVTVDADGNEISRTPVMTKTTTDEETLYFGHRSSDSSAVPQLYKNRLYCLVEESAPAGYVIDSEPYYFEFKEKGYDAVNHPTNVTLHQFISGGTYSFTNQFEAVAYAVPVKKIINSKTVVSSTEFSFTLKQRSTDANAAYIDDSHTTAIPTQGIRATIAGSGETLFDKLYFTKTGTYTFLLTEDDLSDQAVKMGYTKDNNTFVVTVKVGCGEDNALVVESAACVSANASAASGDLSTVMPTFNNQSSMKGTITLNVTKEVTNRAKPVQAGEFAFTVSVGGEVIAEKNDDGTTKMADGKPVKKLFYTEAGGNVTINIDIDQDDIGTKTYIISEVTGGDPTIQYSTDRVRVRVTIAEDGNGGVKATEYEYLTDSVFTNEYKAEGSVTLEGTKILRSVTTGNATSVYKGEFHFIVKEGDTQIATGENEADGSITFTPITYDASDIGVHTYIISEKDEGSLFVEYTDKTVTVKVTVTDAGDGKLATAVQYVSGTLDDNGHALFTNKYTLIVPAGIHLDILPYALLVVAAAGGIGILMVAHRQKRRGKRN